MKKKIAVVVSIVVLFACKNTDNNTASKGNIEDSSRIQSTQKLTTLDSLQGEWIDMSTTSTSIEIKKDSFFYIYPFDKSYGKTYVGRIYMGTSCVHEKQKLQEGAKNGSYINVLDSSGGVECYAIDEMSKDSLNLFYNDEKGLGTLIRKK